MKVAFYTLGCKVNIYESESMMNDFKNNGYEIVPFSEEADVYIINTCTVTNNSDQKSRKIIRSASKNNKDAIIVVVGCYSQIKYEEAKNIEGVSIIIGNKYKNQIISLIEKFKKDRKQIVMIEKLENEKFESMKVSSFENHTRAFIKIQDGCNNFCSYCIIPYSRGNVRSKAKEDVLKEANELVNNGYKEIVLTGIHTGHYGQDLDNYDLSDLLLELEEIKDLKRIRISSIEITEITDKFLDVLKNSEKIVDHMNIPLQSWSDKILKLMNRKYLIDYYFETIEKIRSIRPDIAITTDVIVGFPGETEEDFIETFNNIEKLKFTELHVFPYSNRSGTVSSKMKNQIDRNIKKERVRKLIDLSNKLKNEYYMNFINEEKEVLTEKYEDGYLIGHLSNYGKVKFKGDEADKNKIINVKLEKYEKEFFKGVNNW